MKMQKVLSTTKYTAVIFAAMVLYCVVKGFEMSSTGLYSLFLADFSIGICSRLLVGSIIGIFKDVVTREWVVGFLQVVTFAVFLVTAHYTGSTFTKAEKLQRQPLAAFVLLFIICPFSITIYAGDIFGFIDVFCMILLLMTAYFCENRILIYFMPLLFVTGVFTHDCFVTGYMAPCFAILAYFVIKTYGRKLRASLIFVFSAIAGIGTTCYTVLFSRKTIRMTVEECLAHMAAKGNTTIEDVSGYIEDVVLFSDVRQVAPADAARTPANNIYYMIKYALEGLSFSELVFFISIIPMIVLFFYIWIKAAKNSKGFFEKLPYILFMLSAVPQLLSLVISIDFTRFLSTIIISQTLYLFMCVRRKDEHVCSFLDKASDKAWLFFSPLLVTFLTNIFK